MPSSAAGVLRRAGIPGHRLAAVVPVVQSVRCMKVDPEHPVGRIMTAVECILHSTVLKVLNAGRSLPCSHEACRSFPTPTPEATT
jgi:hypothetical protein